MSILTGIHESIARTYYTKISGDLQDLKAKVARVQDNAEELLALLKEHVTEEQAMRYGFLTNVVKALEMRGYGARIRFRESPLAVLPRHDEEKMDLGSLPYYEILERRGLVAYAARA
jgi:hypothetical protein